MPGRLRILLVDDEMIDQMIYRRVIDRSRIEADVLGFVYPDEALEFLKQPEQQKIDLVLLDVNMP